MTDLYQLDFLWAKNWFQLFPWHFRTMEVCVGPNAQGRPPFWVARLHSGPILRQRMREALEEGFEISLRYA